MSNWDRKFSNGSYYTAWNGRLVYNLNSQSTGGNYSNISLTLQAFSDGSAYSQSGTWDPKIYINGGLKTAPGGSHSISNSPVTLASWSGNVGHDANGNLSITLGDYINAPVNEMVYGTKGWTLPRIALAPTISNVSVTPGTIGTTTVQLRAEISSIGHGTSATWTMYYRLLGAGSWTSAGSQTDGAGYNYWNLSGLKPGKTYQFYAKSVNNNGDTTNSSTYTFDTKAVAAMTPLLIGLL